jgi:hypothetical protein
MALGLPFVLAAIAYKLCKDLQEDLPLEEFEQSGEPPVGPTELPSGDPTVSSPEAVEPHVGYRGSAAAAGPGG